MKGVFVVLIAAAAAHGQTPAVSVERTPIGYELAVRSADFETSPFRQIDKATVQDEQEGSGIPFRQSLLIGGLAASMAAYGYFILEFNNSRGDASVAERAYEEDVRQNAQSYVDQGIELDEIQSFRDWQSAYDDAKTSREWAARAGFLAIVIGFFAILDAATSHEGAPPAYSGLSLSPSIGLAADQDNLIVGARLKF